MTGKPAPVFFRITWRYITPTLLLTIFIFTLAQYQPPTYGSYIYPDYAASFGWCLAVIPCIPLVVVMCMVIYKEEGTMLQRLKKTMRPDSSWGPAISSYRELYCHTHTANS
ncbi:sodium- and chloride-dependent glycine transporter 1-like [Haliotis rufescens]|uniref:sodium- and chloride-dependent glycine transporter 1-like n=1 Tax=Haliotis rufescens TaxID=6454 RepID=UPI00201F6CEC|nr:sodium- and chloride-dependent glycine transporter 1-like [Haliotis rufescens]